MQVLKSYIRQYIELSDEEFEWLLPYFRSRTIQKDEYLLSPGQTCRDFVFLKRGVCRIFSLEEDKETTIWIAFAGELVSELSSYFKQAPTDLYVQAMEHCELWSMSLDNMELLYQKFPKWQVFVRKVWEETITHMIQRISSLLRETADKRYNSLATDQDYMQRVPLKYLASFLGINAASLSRIRNKKTKPNRF